MLKISEMAKLTNTTRRTLIFYDQENLFKPKQKTSAGYRYYEYQQLYDLMFIPGLRSLDFSVEEIKAIKNQPQELQTSYLRNAHSKVSQKITDFERIRQVLDQKIANQTHPQELVLYQPSIKAHSKVNFWCSRQSVDCTEAEIAQLYSEFYQQLDAFAIMDTTESGYLTKLSVEQPAAYDDASFRIIKETLATPNKALIPVIAKDDGDYACILVENSHAGIHRGLVQLKEFCQEQQLKTESYLWQINAGDPIKDNGGSEYLWLDFAIIDSADSK